ncbi:hypothetical protein [Mucilaginibacter kameinonensis]|uniref:hypothetical protein n=1 Tax=Mucilaginibacter kameinonensis TaxID=452286 RepID=UPI0013CF1C34|nr:hypothetical protein [Mucilaginibacter kameinonensis]
MKRNLYLLLPLFLMLTGTAAYSADPTSSSDYYRAAYVKKFYDTDAKTITITKEIQDLLANDIYYKKGTPINKTLLDKNPFFKGLFEDPGAMGGGNLPAGFSKGITALGNVDVTKFANAIADLMIDRAKQELTVAFFNRFKKLSDKYPEFQLMFPKTSDNLRNLLSFTYPQMLPKLRDGFFDDLQQVTYNLEAVLELPKYQTLMENFPEVPAAIACVKLMHEIEDGASPDKVIVDIDQAISDIEGKPFYTNASDGFKNLVATVHFAKIFSESLSSTTPSRSWVTPTELKTMFADDITTNKYLTRFRLNQ